MHTTDIHMDYNVSCTLNGQNVDCILKDICDACHKGLERASMLMQESDENPSLNTAKNWKEECENLERILCRILDLLGD